MKKKNSIVQVVEADSENYNALTDFEEVLADSSSGAIGINITESGKRIRLNAGLVAALDDPKALRVLLNKSAAKAALVAVPEGTPGSYKVGKSATIYASELAERIMDVASGVKFHEKGTTPCGVIEQVQADQNGSLTAILNFEQ